MPRRGCQGSSKGSFASPLELLAQRPYADVLRVARIFCSMEAAHFGRFVALRNLQVRARRGLETPESGLLS